MSHGVAHRSNEGPPSFAKRNAVVTQRALKATVTSTNYYYLYQAMRG